MVKMALIVLAVIVLILGLLELPYARAVFLDVGQGDAILLQDGPAQVLIDGGEGMQVLERLAREMPWFDRNIELVILTHPERDHMEGLIHVLDRYNVGMIVLPHIPRETQLQEVWLTKLVDSRIPYRFAWRGQHLGVGDISITILGPFDTPFAQAAMEKTSNNASVVTRVDFNMMSLLLTGDAERQVEHWLVQKTNPALLNVDILKAGHHGSKTSTTQALINAASPSTAVISVGSDNNYGHPHESVLQRLQNVPVYRTDKVGSVRFSYSHGRWYKAE